MMNQICHGGFVLIVALVSLAARAQNEGVIELNDRVTGNQEQPQVLYIVPWQAPGDDSILSQPVQSQLNNDVFEHIERPEHEREVEYLQQLWQQAAE